jgi:predicted RNase H-like HicB family nuclease
MTNYAVVIERASGGGYGAWCPDCRLCRAGNAEDAVLAEMQQTIELHLAGSAKTGADPIPRRWRQPLSLSTQPDRCVRLRR